MGLDSLCRHGGYVGPVAHEITYDAQREPMFQDDQGNGWVPEARYMELVDTLHALRREFEARGDLGASAEDVQMYRRMIEVANV